MTGKDLKRLSRSDLLEMLLELSKENDKLRIDNNELQQQLEDRKLAIDQFGSLAEAALHLNGVFEAAQAACEQYTENVQYRSEHLREYCAQLERDTQLQCEAKKTETEARCGELLAQTQAQCAQWTEKNQEERNTLLAQTQEACNAMIAQAQQKSADILAEAQEQARAILDEAGRVSSEQDSAYAWLRELMGETE